MLRINSFDFCKTSRKCCGTFKNSKKSWKWWKTKGAGAECLTLDQMSH